MRDLHELPKLRDGLSYLYLEHGRIAQKQKAVEFIDKEGGHTMIPAAALAVLMLGPGTSITHAAIKALADNGCLAVWVGEDGMRCYAQGGGETRKAYHLLKQAELASDPEKRLKVVMRMYLYRFGEQLQPGLRLEQVRGLEGVRVRQAYARASQRYGVEWHGRRYDRSNWNSGDPINRAISAANALLNGLCHAGIVSGGYSPAIGFIHTGKQLSFVYDIADLYKVDLTIPLAFRIVAESTRNLHSRVRQATREAFKEHRLLKRILPDIENLLDLSVEVLTAGQEADSDSARPEPLWSPPDQVAQMVAPVDGVDSNARQRRRQRAQEGLSNGWAVRRRVPGVWNVVTRADSPGYTIRQIEGAWRCDCPDFANNKLGMCKHTVAVELTLAAQESERGV
ncbi:MAG: type I-E CRISPR-associated endonuclease Cas1 [Chloroflexi bacterium]|nr:MAG: type I-E CRISPR-associated endonuclease Cas1 [Chloroflexota bacterium]RLC87362.1 MAG: type I-E CRISPR-associated endonuclease Cas1 [Chloroflexota bacterium]